MSREVTLRRVEDDLAVGHVLIALTRLRGLVAAYPEDLLLRHRLAELYRKLGETAEAGRWAYLSPDLTEDERTAFKKQFPDPLHRMRVLHWHGPEEEAPTRLARDRLTQLRAEAEERTQDRLAYVALGRRRHVRRRTGLTSVGLFSLAFLLVLAGVGCAAAAVGRLATAMF